MKISRCRFCGSKLTEKNIKTQYLTATLPKAFSIVCAPRGFQCGAHGPLEKTKGKAVESWNEINQIGDIRK